MGKVKRGFQDTDYVLRLFGQKLSAARKAYRAYVQKGISQGRRPELVGGGLIRSAGGWSAVKALRQEPARMKGDERILGDGEFARLNDRSHPQPYFVKYLPAAGERHGSLRERRFDLL